MKTLNNIKQGFISLFRANRVQLLVAIILSIILSICVSCTEDVPPYIKGIDDGITIVKDTTKNNNDTIIKEIINIDGVWEEHLHNDLDSAVIKIFTFKNNGGNLVYTEDNSKYELYYTANMDSAIITIPDLDIKYKFLGFGEYNRKMGKDYTYTIKILWLMGDEGEVDLYKN